MKTTTYETGIQVIDGKGNVNEFNYTLNDIEYDDGSKLYETCNYGKILVKDKKLVKLIDDYCDNLNPKLFNQLENESDEIRMNILKIID